MIQKKKKVGNNRKYTIEEVRQIFKDGGCTLISKEYKTNKDKLEYICHCKKVKEICLSNFIKGKRCRECSNEKLRLERQFTIEQVRQIFLDSGCLLLSKEYKNNQSELTYICPQGHEMTTNLIKFNALDSNKCAKCSKKWKFSTEEARGIFSTRGFTLLEKEYINSSIPMLYQCSCGNVSRMSLANFRHNQNCQNCKGDKISKATKGKNNAFWDFELGEEERVKSRRIEGYNRWIYSVYLRDGFKCVICGDTESGLHAHHKDGYHWCGERRTDITNGVTLCAPHHRHFHSIYGFRDNTESQFNEYLKSININFSVI